jgi:hypothetical protein
MIWLKLLGVLNWVKKALTAFLDLARRYPLQAALIASLCLAGWLWWGKREALSDLAAEKASHALTIKAGKDAYAAQVALHAKDLAAFKAAKKDTDDAHKPKLAAALDRTDRYSADNSLRKACARFIPASPAAEGPVAESSDEPGISADMVAVTAEDVRVCTVNTVRLQSVWEWGQELVAKGLAE